MRIFVLLIYGFVQMLFVTECGKPNLKGNWYFFDKDSLYIEVYINDSFVTLNHPLAGLATNQYLEKNGSIVLSDNQLPVDTIKILRRHADSIMLLTNLDTLKLFRIYNINNFHDIKACDNDRMDEFIDKYNKRLRTHSE
jgi:hypothetical protein